MASKFLSVEIPGKPEPQGSARAFVVGGRARVSSANANLKSWRAVAVHEIRAAMKKNGWPEACAACGFSIIAAFFFARPKSHLSAKGGLKKSAPRHHTATPDLDKCLRALCDALTIAGAWKDDSQCATASCGKHYAELGESPRTMLGLSLTIDEDGKEDA